ncbi:gamma-secretase subunit PEN-2 [Octopus bimaculoides]|uniref:Gamma-secretase subunit PEN-2 n=1 Tax=Octopus bimaculoides TaxID=37653 RepID=A0A0L8HE12_OCTBM|nr:gamma-secretase subunit PEN-2 [Octopus bimaculoides]|eukprot:XP_014773172.1 PREDICTED: gamma-secretase subunit PEN-2-like [Octopus bimaculoides]
MDLRRVKDDVKLDLCRTYYKGGFALLPFLWFINFLWFFREAYRRPEFEQQKQIRTYVTRSLIGSLIWFSIMIIWIIIFQMKRAEWGAVADYMSFIIPTGRA